MSTGQQQPFNWDWLQELKALFNVHLGLVDRKSDVDLSDQLPVFDGTETQRFDDDTNLLVWAALADEERDRL